MTVKQFQYEPEQSEIASSHPKNNRFPIETKHLKENTSFIEPMLFGLLVRGWLSDRSKEFIDRLAPENSISFIISGDKYLAPEDVTLFPHELIETAINENTSAVFSHIFRPRSNFTHNYMITTATINPGDKHPVVFGILGPDDVLSNPLQQERFQGYVAKFRTAYQSAKKMAEKLDEHINSTKPTILVNRSSGRVLYVNSSLEQIVSMNLRELVHLEFNQIKELFPDPTLFGKLILQNYSSDNFQISVMSFNKETLKSPSPNSPTRFLLDKISMGVSNISKTGFILEKNLSEFDNESTNHLAAAINNQTKNLQPVIQMLDDIIERKPSQKRINLLYELDKAIQQKGDDYAIQLHSKVNNLYLKADLTAYRIIFSAVLNSHLKGKETPSSTTITVDKTNFLSEFNIHFNSSFKEVNDGLELSDWNEFAHQICRENKVILKNMINKKTNKLVTTLTIKTD